MGVKPTNITFAPALKRQCSLILQMEVIVNEDRVEFS